jgi:hypothetical protein
MLDTISSNRIEPVSFIKLGSSSTDGEDRDWNLDYLMIKGYYPAGHYLSFDVTSHFVSMAPVLENETYKYIEAISEEMIEHDIFVKMPPKRRRTVTFKIKSIRKAKPRIVIPEYPYIDI